MNLCNLYGVRVVILVKREVLDKDIKTDTIIIGAGMAGILIGYMLKQNGIDVILIDAAEMASGNTKNTTAKITSQHDLIYDKLISEFGEKKASKICKRQMNLL